MVEYVANELYGALPQRNLHINASGTQDAPVIAHLAGGGFVAGWISDRSFFVQRYDAQGIKVGGEQSIVSGGLSLIVSQPALVGLSGGGFAAAWSANGIYAQTFDASGAAISGVFAASTSPPIPQMQQPTLGAEANNGLVIAWTDASGNGAGKVYARVFDALGAGLTGEIVVAANYPDNNYFPKVSVQADGDFLVAWTGSYTALSGERFSPTANARLYDAAGNPKSGVVSSHDFQSTPGFHDAYYESITTLTSGRFVMTWTDSTGNGDAIRGQIYDSDGALIGAQFQVNPANGLAAGQSTVAWLDNGGFMVTWRPDTSDGGPNYSQHGDILAQAFDAAGAKVGAAFVVNNTTSLGQDTPAVAAFGSGDFAVIWHTWTSGTAQDVAIKLYYSTIDGTTNGETLTGTPDTDYINGLGGDDILIGLGSNNVLDGGDGDDFFRLEQGANDTALGGAGNDAFYFGAAFSPVDIVDGGAGTRDQLGLQGNYAGGVTFGNNVTGIEQVILLPGSDTRFGDVSGAFYSYAITTGNAAIAAGAQMVFQANILRSGENFTLDASGEVDGSVFTYGGQGNDLITGSQGSDAFFFGTARFGSGDVVNGQGGALDSLGLQGNYAGASAVSFGAGQLIGVEQLVFLSNSDTRFGGAGSGTPYNYTITTHDGNVAAGARMIIQANTLVSDEVLNFNGSAELDGVFSIFSGNGADTLRGGAGNDTISGRGGADMLFGGGGNDTFLFTNLTDSGPNSNDSIADFSNGDLIDLSRIDAIFGGSDDAFSFIGDAAFSAPGQLRVTQLFNQGYLVEADVNGDTIADFALVLTITDNHPITVNDFFL